MRPGRPAIEVRDLVKRFDDVEAVRGDSFAVARNGLYVAAGVAAFLAAFRGARRRGTLRQIGE